MGSINLEKSQIYLQINGLCNDKYNEGMSINLSNISLYTLKGKYYGKMSPFCVKMARKLWAIKKVK